MKPYKAPPQSSPYKGVRVGPEDYDYIKAESTRRDMPITRLIHEMVVAYDAQKK